MHVVAPSKASTPPFFFCLSVLLSRKILRLPLRECNWWQCGQVVCASRRERAFQGIRGFQASHTQQPDHVQPPVKKPALGGRSGHLTVIESAGWKNSGCFPLQTHDDSTPATKFIAVQAKDGKGEVNIFLVFAGNRNDIE